MVSSSGKSRRSSAKANSVSKARISPTGKAVRGKSASRQPKKSAANITSGDMALLSRDLREFIESLNTQAVQHLIVGGIAVAFHGHPRYTKDLDVWVGTDHENAIRLIKALDEFGMGSLGLNPKDFEEQDTFVQLGYDPNRIDLITSLVGVDFDKCYATRVEVSDGELKLNFIDLESLKANKRASGRLQDLADVENLE